MSQDNLQDSGNREEPDGIYQPLYPGIKGSALTHTEMDYNLDLIGQVIKGYRVMGSGAAGSLDLINDTNKVLKLYKVQSGDAELLTAGALVDDYVWIPAAAAVDGSQGYQGAQGDQGFQGFQGIDGVQGSIGFQGDQGLTGDQGFQGAAGFQGFQGIDGVQGSVGFQGFKGDQGDQGISGPFSGTDVDPNGSYTGEYLNHLYYSSNGGVWSWDGTSTWILVDDLNGDQGFQGVLGFQGDKGDQGDTGNQGDQGFQGLKGTKEIGRAHV
jgi:hypothetical protein